MTSTPAFALSESLPERDDSSPLDGADARTPATTPQQTQNIDRLASAMVLGFASAGWFGWGMQGDRFVGLLIGGMVAGLFTGVLASLSRRGARGLSTHQIPGAGGQRTWWKWVLIETVCIVPMVWWLTATGRDAYNPAWTLAVVGAHFLPLATFYRLAELRVAGIACLVIAALSAVAGLAGWAPPATVCALLGGSTMLLIALAAIRTARASIRKDLAS